MSAEKIYLPTISDKENIKIPPGSLKVSGDGVFYTIQGEGASIGYPAVFCRLHFCNLACTWCDTKYTWDRNKEAFWKEAQSWSIEKTVAEITQFDANRVVFTGGEPLLQQAALQEVAEQLPAWNIEVETNGTIKPQSPLRERAQFNVSPKLSSSGNPEIRCQKLEVLADFNKLDKTIFKFVAENTADLAEIDEVVEKNKLDQNKVIISPLGVTIAQTRESSLNVVDGVISRGWRLLPRMHILLWDDQRGK